MLLASKFETLNIFLMDAYNQDISQRETLRGQYVVPIKEMMRPLDTLEFLGLWYHMELNRIQGMRVGVYQLL